MDLSNLTWFDTLRLIKIHGPAQWEDWVRFIEDLEAFLEDWN